MLKIKRPPRPDGDPAEGFHNDKPELNINQKATDGKPLTWKDYETFMVNHYIKGGMSKESALYFAQGEINAILAGNHRTHGKPTLPDPQAVIIAALVEYELTADERDAYSEAAERYEHDAHMGRADAEDRAMTEVLHRRPDAVEHRETRASSPEIPPEARKSMTRQNNLDGLKNYVKGRSA